jgi:hypothetical protein
VALMLTAKEFACRTGAVPSSAAPRTVTATQAGSARRITAVVPTFALFQLQSVLIRRD